MKITLGGERLGSGKKMDTALHNYGRSTHNLSQSWKSTMAPGVLVPFLKLLATNGDTFDIDLNAGLRTIPTKAPIYGSFKLQLDVFQCPIRLYQGILHNNPINIGLQMHNVLLPQIPLLAYKQIYDNDKDNSQVAPNSLYKYLGISGAGSFVTEDAQIKTGIRYFNGVPFLAYYDIFKNYYANKQEENAYVIMPNVPNGQLGTAEAIERVSFISAEGGRYVLNNTPTNNIVILDDAENPESWQNKYGTLTFIFPENVTEEQIKAVAVIVGEETKTIGEQWINAEENGSSFIAWIERNPATNKMLFKIEFKNELEETWASLTTPDDIEIKTNWYTTKLPIKIESFKLENIDKMRNRLLSATTLGQAVKLDPHWGSEDLPYMSCTYCMDDLENQHFINAMAYPMNGLVLKTYQADIFNNWLQTEWIDGDNGIAAVTAVDVSSGALDLDALNLAQKIYNMLNRIAASGGTYQDWQKAVYTNNVIMHAETPIWCGGMSSEVVFDEVVSTADTEDSPLGGLAGKGTLKGKKGGKMHIKVNEPSYIIGIVSITPRVDYTQGNDFDMTDIYSVDDIHKPELDGIGFQDLIVEQMAWWNTQCSIDNQGRTQIYRDAVGKIPAWLNYMTAVNKSYGDFARAEGKSYMVLNRNYGHDNTKDYQYKEVTDLTTYIDPSKYNYAFAQSELAAQNFWVQIVSDIKARRIMSAKIIPNL